jgi:hypothetical protein
MYDLLSRWPGAIVMDVKENCPDKRSRSHWAFFQSQPEFKDVKENSLIIDGCVDVLSNMKIRLFLHNPTVFYIVMIRDYADMLWSSYNFWCHIHYDTEACSFDRWANKKYHRRSPELFQELIHADSIGNRSMQQPFYYPMHRPCANAGGYYTEYVDLHIYRLGLKNDTIVVASEELDVRPLAVTQRLASIMGIHVDLEHYAPRNFSQVRINTQDNKGANNEVSVNSYKPGRYNISNYRPMLNETRELLNSCWQADCIAIIERWGYVYQACLEGYLRQYQLARVPNATAYAWSEEERRSAVNDHAMQRLGFILHVV